MRAPAFWFRPAGLLAHLLWPLGWLYGWATIWRMTRVGEKPGVPVICIGNFTAGGAGKTPTTIMIAQWLTARGEKPFVISRGYGGQLKGPVRVDLSRHSASECGDEPLLLARHVPTVISRDKLEGARFALAAGASVILLDDGLQNPALHKDLTVAVVDGAVGIGNGRCLPAGPLRAPLEAQIGQVDIVLVIGAGAAGDMVAAIAASCSKPTSRASLVPDTDVLGSLRAKRLLAFAGIGRPEKFFSTLQDAGLNVIEMRAFGDHHVYTTSDLNGLQGAANELGLTLVTTEKDQVRIGPNRMELAVLPVELQTGDGILDRHLKSLVARVKATRTA